MMVINKNNKFRQNTTMQKRYNVINIEICYVNISNLGEDIKMTCKYCNSEEMEYLLSDTNSEYTYCKSCNKDFDLVHKNIAIDALLKRLLKFVNTSKERKLKIEIDKENNFILLKINNEIILKKEFKYNFANKDVYYLENIVFELVQDNYKFDTSNVDIIVC